MVESLKKLLVRMNLSFDDSITAQPGLNIEGYNTSLLNFEDLEKKWIGISPGASYYAKRLPLDHWKDILSSNV